MQKENKPKVLILTVKWGHYSIAKAIESALGENFQTEVQFIKVEKLSDLSYTTVYRLFPNIGKIPFKLAERDIVKKTIYKYLERAYLNTVKESMENFRPDIVINAYFAFIPSLEILQKEYKFLFINAISDPKTFSPIEISKNAYNLAFDNKAKKKCESYGFPKEKSIVTGWFVREKFQKISKEISGDNNLKTNYNKFTVCVVGGSEGTYYITKILPAFLNSPNPVRVIFICGKNKSLLKAITTFSKIIEKTSRKTSEVIPVGFTNDIHTYIQSSNLVIGKAGPNLLFETVATCTPFFAISHIAGQEDGNLEIINEYRLGFVEENPVRAIKLLRKIIKNPKILYNFQTPLKKMSEYNKNSYAILRDFIDKKLQEK